MRAKKGSDGKSRGASLSQPVLRRSGAPLLQILLAVILPLTIPPACFAERAVAGLYTNNSIGASYNNLGVMVDDRLFWRIPLSGKDGILWESTKFDIGLQSQWTPADEIVGLRVTLEPIAFFSLTARANFYSLYNTFGYGLYTFDSSDAPYNPAITGKMDPGNGAGLWIAATPELKVKAGRFILVNSATINVIRLDARGYFLELRNYAMHKARDVDITNDVNALVEITPKILAGANYHFLNVFGTDVQSHRVSALCVLLRPKAKIGDLFAAANAGYYLADPAFGKSVYVGVMAGADTRLRPRRTAVTQGKDSQ